MFKTLLKFLLPALGGSGIVCLTMHLTNTNGNLFNSLNLLNIKEKPEIDEETLQPIQEPQPSEPSTTQDSQEPESSQTSEETSPPSTESNSESSEENKASLVTDSGTTTDVDEVIRYLAQEINDKGEYWAGGGSKELKSVHQLISTVTKFVGALNQKTTQEQQAQ